MAQETARIAAATPRGNRRGPKSKKIANSLVALSSAAIVTVYGVGYFRTQAAADALTTNIADSATVAVATAAPTATTVVPTATTAPLPTRAPSSQFPVFNPGGLSSTPVAGNTGRLTPTATVPATATASPTASVAASPTKSTITAAYKDGTYVGSGTSRHGSIQATVVIQSGKIVSANITQCGTRYPCSWIAALPGEVVTRQSASVDFVSGATDSSEAYQGAIRSALAKAAA